MDGLLKLEVERRVVNWGYAMAGGGDGFGGPQWSPMFALNRSSEVREGSRVPILYGEAEETDKVMRALLQPQSAVLQLQYLSSLPTRQKREMLKLTNGAYYRLAEFAHKKFMRELRALRSNPGFFAL